MGAPGPAFGTWDGKNLNRQIHTVRGLFVPLDGTARSRREPSIIAQGGSLGQRHLNHLSPRGPVRTIGAIFDGVDRKANRERYRNAVSVLSPKSTDNKSVILSEVWPSFLAKRSRRTSVFGASNMPRTSDPPHELPIRLRFRTSKRSISPQFPSAMASEHSKMR